MERFIFLSLILINLVLTGYNLMTVKGVEMKTGFILNLLTGEFKKKNEK